MKKFRWILALAAAAVMLCAFCGAAAEEVPADAIALQLDAEQSVTLEAGEAAWFSFVSTENVAYQFVVTVPSDAYGELYRMTETGLENISSSGDTGGNGYFTMPVFLEAGQTYYLKAWLDNAASTGRISAKASLYPDLFVSAVGSSGFYLEYGNVAILEVQASSGFGNLTYQWAKANSYGVLEELEGETGKQYTTTVREEYSQYYCIVTDGHTTNYVEFYVYGNDAVQVEANGSTDRYINYGDSVELSVTASSMSGILEYQWYRTYKDQRGFTCSERIEGADGPSLTTGRITQAESQYRCTVYGKNGACNNEYFNIYADAQVSIGEDVTVYLQLGESTTLVAQAECPAELSYQWYILDEQNNYEQIIEGANDSVYTTGQMCSSGTYICRVANYMGVAYSQRFHVKLEEDFSVSPASWYVSPYERVTFQPYISNQGSHTLTYQWYEQIDYLWEQLQPIEGAIDSTYIISASKAGYYPCQITSDNGIEKIVYNELRINNGLGADTESRNVYGSAGEPLELLVEAGSSYGDILYQWYKGDVYAYVTGQAIQIDGANEASYFMTEQKKPQETYTCEVRDIYNNIETVSVEVNLQSNLSVSYASDSYIAVAIGGSATMAVQAESAGDISYQWYLDRDEGDIILEGETGSSLTVSNIQAPERYECVILDSYIGSAYYCFTVDIIDDLTAEAVGDNSVTIRPDEGALLAVNAQGSGTLSYQWRKYLYDQYGRYLCVPIDGATAATFNVTDIEYNGQQIVCEVTNSCDFRRQVDFWIYVDNDLSATYAGESNSLTVELGKTADMTVLVTAIDTANMTYSWFKKEYDYDKDEWGEPVKMSGSESNLTSDPAVAWTEYACQVTDRFEGVTWVSFYLQIDNSLQAFAGETGENYTSMTITPGEPAVLKVKVSASDDTGITYQWERRYVQSGVWRTEELPEVTGDTCDLSNQEAQGEYVCTVKDRYGNTCKVTFAITVDNAFSAVIAGTENDHWMYDDVEPGEPFAMAVEARGNDLTGVTYLWSYNIYNPETDEYESGWLEDATGSEYTADAVSAVGAYYCEVNDGYGNSETINFIIRSIKNNLKVTEYGTDNSNVQKSIPVGENAEMRVTVSALNTENLRYQWYIRTYGHGNGPGGLSDDPIAGARSDTYTVEKIQTAGTYYCQVKDCYGNLNSVFFTLNIDNEFTAVSAGDTDISVYYGEPARLEVSASCRSGELTYEWYDINNDTLIDGANGSVFEISAVTDRYTYRCHVADQYGNYNDIWFYVRVRTDLRAQIKQAPQIAVHHGERATLEVEASCNYGDIQYQWAVDNGSPMGLPISGATAASYTTDPVYEATSYKCQVTDMFGSGMSVRCRVTIDNGLSVEPVGETRLRVPVNGQANLAVNASCLAGELTYQWASQPWQLNTEAWENIPGANAAEYTTAALTENTEFRCQVTDQYGNTGSVLFYVYCSDTDKLNPPTIQILDSGTLGQDVLAQIGYPAGAIYVWAEFGYINENGDFNSLKVKDIYDYDPSFSVPGYLLLEDLHYQIRALALARELWDQPSDIIQDSDLAVVDLELAQAEIPDGPEVMISGGTEYDYSVEGIKISYTIPEAEETAYRLTLTNPVSGETIFSGRVSDVFTGETAEITLDVGENQFEFWAKYNGVWSRLSEPYTVVLNPVGYLDIPTVKVDGNEISDSLIVKTNAIPTLEVSCGNAEVIDCVIRRDGDWVASASINGESGECDLSSALQTPGEYMLDLYAWNRGWLTKGHKYISVTVRAPELTNILNLPAGLITIESEAFAGLTNVDAVRIPASVESIADDAFSGSSIVIIAPAGSENIISWAESHGFECVTE